MNVFSKKSNMRNSNGCHAFIAAAIVMSFVGAAPALGGILFTEGNFDSWTTHAVHAPGANSGQTFSVSSTGGNPGGMFTAYSTRTDAGQVESAHIKGDQFTLSPLSGSFTLTFDYQRAAAAGTGFYGTGLAIRQGTNYWYLANGAVNDSATWMTNGVVTGNFNSSAPLNGSSGSPVLTGGVPTYFGFFTYLNGPPGGVWGSNFDNLVLSTPNNIVMQGVPEPTTLGLLGAIGVIALRRRRNESR
ncbi:MAG TPA: PEP-CTERM sorting domain-containing protein [Tepidisphaeraceae bacterium]|nr:PEP-CTERM sorting domain-containing protein [Tepidisphaeraceae bacterium]